MLKKILSIKIFFFFTTNILEKVNKRKLLYNNIRLKS